MVNGLSVAEKFHSNYYTVTFTGLLSDLYRMQERVDESLSLISNAKDERIKILDLATLDATLHMVQGDIYAAPSISKENDSYEEYQLGIAQLQSIISPTTPLLPVELDEK
ncbi:hypothetical protein HK103_004905 [Boothiomyces macroporosus]|uniref:Uncharacterized protein n=1 Tax=Boothiomyces macroporosus TaxID=261099 RepID=A0AAD5Y376_9FUNG|nr:hypothetical protein HK103_004905 [Boothiomyces macroporosus]